MRSRRRWPAVLLAVLAAPAAFGADARVTIRGIGVDLGETPLYVAIEGAGLEPGAYVLRPTKGDGEPIDAQVVRDGESTALALVLLLIGGVFSLIYLRGQRLEEGTS